MTRLIIGEGKNDTEGHEKREVTHGRMFVFERVKHGGRVYDLSLTSRRASRTEEEVIEATFFCRKVGAIAKPASFSSLPLEHSRVRTLEYSCHAP